MSNTSAKPDHYTWMTPYLTVISDAAKMIAFYEQAFGFNKMFAAEEDNGAITHVEMTYKGQPFMFSPEGFFDNPNKAPINSGVPAPINLYVYCEDVDDLYEKAVQAGAVSKLAPEDMFWGDRMCSLQDPSGHIWNFATHIG